ncbi:DUF2141 domain-containing protein [Sphingomicrobium sediminis]|uniref:DUF2141 domain-containing protein n=1 Tax=Sphingomicrobium sediminis TaxID=2950949 RepID=A0A9X2J3W6_9SPHN|nr:DUF2141 domain-containing protein [Sphingomicrobium sediminis]MCM8558505.1 DUF2141 domain-containing protein [Sphingomicrobium sediminis]
MVKWIASMSSAALVAGSLAIAPRPAHAVTVIGDVGACDRGESSILIRVHGFKSRTGELRLSLYDGNPSNWLVGGRKIHKLHMDIPRSGPVDICVKTPGPGTYAFGIQHDVDGDGEIGRRDGGAYSNNAKFTIFDREPAFRKVKFEVGSGTKRMGIRLLYLKGLSIVPWN